MNYYFHEFYEKLKSDSRFSSLNGRLIENRRKSYKNGMELEQKELLIIFEIKTNKYNFDKVISFSLTHIIETKETLLVRRIHGNSFKYAEMEYKNITKNLYNEICSVLEGKPSKVAQ